MLHTQKAFLKLGNSFEIGKDYILLKKKSTVEEFSSLRVDLIWR